MVIVICVLCNYGVEALINAYSNKIPPVSCGKRLVKHTPLIVDGHESQDGVWPWHASVFHVRLDWDIDYKCGGTLVSSNAILTASHCVYENGEPLIPERIVIQLGRSNLKTFGLNSKEFKV